MLWDVEETCEQRLKEMQVSVVCRGNIRCKRPEVGQGWEVKKPGCHQKGERPPV